MSPRAEVTGVCCMTDADWVREDTFTFFTTDGLVHIGGAIRPSFEVHLLSILLDNGALNGYGVIQCVHIIVVFL